MAESLFVQLPANGAAAAWAAFDATGALLNAVSHGPLAAARAAAEGRRVIALAPAVEILTMQTALPATSQARLRQMLPYSLEDSLAADVETLSFAVGPRLASGSAAVAVVASERLNGWVAALRDAGLSPHAIYSEAEGVPDLPGTMTLAIQGGCILGRLPGQLPVAFEGLGLRQVLDLLRSTAAEPAALRNALVYVDAAGRALFAAELAALPDEFAEAEVKLVSDGLFPRLAATLAQRPGTNLLQGVYAPRSNWLPLIQPWRVAAALLAAALVLALVLEGAEYWSLRRADGALATAVAAGCERVVAATREAACEAEVQRRLRALGAGPSGETFLSTLTAVAAARDAGTRVDSLSYRNRTLSLQLLVDTIPALDKFARDLEGTRRFTTKIDSANQGDKGVEGRIQVSGVAPR